VRRRKVFVVQCVTFAVMVASAVLGWRLADAEGSLAAVRAGLFGLFTLAAFTLFVVVLVDFDRWVDDVRPYPKRAIRGRVGRGTRTVARLTASILAGYATVMTWLWSWVGAALAWAIGGIGIGLTWSWVRVGDGMSWVLVPYRTGAGRLWSWVGSGSSWALGHAGTGLTSLWVWLGRRGSWALVRYRAGAGWLWSTTGRAVALTLAYVGAALTSLWVWLTRRGAWLLVRFRTAMTLLWGWAGAALSSALRATGATLTRLWVWLARAVPWLLVRFRAAMSVLWSSVAAALVWALRGAGAVLSSLWVWLGGVGASVAVGCGEGISRMWHATIGGAQGATTIRRKSWYTTAVDSVFGIPPHETTRDASRRSRASRRPGSGRRRRIQRPTFRDDESIGSPPATRPTADAPDIGEPGARYVGRQVTRRGERRKSEELLSAALARFRSAVRQPRDRDAGRDA
jgi:hypothetical protein